MKTFKIGACLAVLGGQYGNEGVGLVVNQLAPSFSVHVRSNGGRAHHAFTHEGRNWSMQYVPSGWTNREALLFIARGCLIDLDILMHEISEIYPYDQTIIHRLYIDENCGIVSKWHTGEGTATKNLVVAENARRTRNPVYFKRLADVVGDYRNTAQGWQLSEMLAKDTGLALSSALDVGHSVLLEGVGGSAMSLYDSEWPYVSPFPISSAQLAANASIPPQFVQSLIVCSTFPMLSPGYDRPLPGEISWGEVAQLAHRNIIAPVERESRKTLRVGTWSDDLARAAIRANGATQLVITDIDYKDPTSKKAVDLAGLKNPARMFIQYLSQSLNVGIPYVFTHIGDVIQVGTLYKPANDVNVPDLAYFGGSDD